MEFICRSGIRQNSFDEVNSVGHGISFDKANSGEAHHVMFSTHSPFGGPDAGNDSMQILTNEGWDERRQAIDDVRCRRRGAGSGFDFQ